MQILDVLTGWNNPDILGVHVAIDDSCYIAEVVVQEFTRSYGPDADLTIAAVYPADWSGYATGPADESLRAVLAPHRAAILSAAEDFDPDADDVSLPVERDLSGLSYR